MTPRSMAAMKGHRAIVQLLGICSLVHLREVPWEFWWVRVTSVGTLRKLRLFNLNIYLILPFTRYLSYLFHIVLSLGIELSI